MIHTYNWTNVESSKEERIFTSFHLFIFILFTREDVDYGSSSPSPRKLDYGNIISLGDGDAPRGLTRAA